VKDPEFYQITAQQFFAFSLAGLFWDIGRWAVQVLQSFPASV